MGQVGVAFGVVLFVLFVRHFLYGVEVLFEVDFLSVSQPPFGVELLFGDDVVGDHVVGDFASEFVSKVRKGFG